MVGGVFCPQQDLSTSSSRVATGSALAEAFSFSRTSTQNILSPPSHKGGIFDKERMFFWGKVRAEVEFHTHDIRGKK